MVKMISVRPDFVIYIGLLMITTKGCSAIRNLKSLICDRDKKFRRYLLRGGGFEGFLRSGSQSQTL